MTLTPKTLPGIMCAVALALLPGSWQYASHYGDLVWLQMGLCMTFALLLESLCLYLHRRPFSELGNLSWLVCGLLLARAMPLLTPAWLLALASMGAIMVAKHGCGGLGKNRLNPVLVGLALVSLCFYQLLPTDIAAAADWTRSLSIEQTLTLQLRFSAAVPADMATGATSLVTNQLSQPMAMEQWSGYLLGGLALALLNVIRLEIPLMMLASTLLTGIALGLNPQESLHNLTMGGMIFAAFFIATDPVTSPDSRIGRLLFAATAGALTELVRMYGLYADGLCFAILAANLLVPQFDQLARRLSCPWYRRTGNNHLFTPNLQHG